MVGEEDVEEDVEDEDVDERTENKGKVNNMHFFLNKTSVLKKKEKGKIRIFFLIK